MRAYSFDITVFEGELTRVRFPERSGTGRQFEEALKLQVLGLVLVMTLCGLEAQI